MSDLNVDGMAIAPSVVETIVSIAAKEVEGVACIGSSAVGGLRSMFASKPSTQGIEVEVGEDESLHITVRSRFKLSLKFAIYNYYPPPLPCLKEGMDRMSS